MSTDYPLDNRLFSLPIKDLPLNRRQQLSGALNVEQIIAAECGLCRDFRGIVQQLKLPYAEIAKLEKMIDPFGTLLSYQLVAGELGSVGVLLRLIANIGRFDVLDDLVPGLLDDLEHFEERLVKSGKLKMNLFSTNNVLFTIFYRSTSPLQLKHSPRRQSMVRRVRLLRRL